MAKWVKQSFCTSKTKSSQTRTSYLAPEKDVVDQIIKNYFEKEPNGELVTVEVLKKLGKDRVEHYITDQRTINRVKQDLGLFIAIRLTEIYEASNILTYREDNCKNVSLRYAPVGTPEWIRKFTPHRLLSEKDTAFDRIILDTSIIKSLVYGGKNDLKNDFFQNLCKLKKSHPVSLADPIYVELLRALFEKRIPWSKWVNFKNDLNVLLDTNLPIAPIGREATALSGLDNTFNINLSNTVSFFQSAWHFLLNAKNVEELKASSCGEIFSQDGKLFKLYAMDPDLMEKEFEKRQSSWQSFIQRMNTGINTKNMSENDMANKIFNEGILYLENFMDKKHLQRLDLIMRILALYAARVNKKKEPYTGKNQNDPIDFDILFGSIYPGIICTIDQKMVSISQSSGSSDSWRVMCPKELIKFLESGEIRPIY